MPAKCFGISGFPYGIDQIVDIDEISSLGSVAIYLRCFPIKRLLNEFGNDAVLMPGTGSIHVTEAQDHGFQIEGVTEMGLVFNPAMDELYVATRGNGATLNGQQISVSKIEAIAKSLFVTGFPYTHDEIFDRSFDLFSALYARCQGIRRLGAVRFGILIDSNSGGGRRLGSVIHDFFPPGNPFPTYTVAPVWPQCEIICAKIDQ